MLYRELDKARIIVDKIIELQQDCGGWIVRNDYDSEGAVPVLAPNDSAYTANNACLEFYLSTGEQKYLDATVKCAEWIINTAREDGMVYVGYDTKRKHWQKSIILLMLALLRVCSPDYTNALRKKNTLPS